MIREQLASRLKLFREKAGMTIYEVGEKVGKSGKTVSAWENGRGQPDADMLLILCELYSINNIAELLGQDISPSNEGSPSYTPLEQEIIKAYRAAPPVLQEAVLNVLHIPIPASNVRQKKNA